MLIDNIEIVDNKKLHKKKKKVLRVFEAFSGYGSQSLALKKYGVNFKTVGISEIDKYAIQAHEAIHGPVKNYGDISKINTLSLPDFDLFTYSFPCQDISMAGKQRGLKEGSESRSSLLWECQKIIELKRPKYLMMENVKNLVGKKHRPDFDRWLEVLEGLGYQNHWKVINAKNCGIPQNRERVFCVSMLGGGDFKFYDDFDSGVRLKDILEDQVDEKYYLSDEKTIGLIKSLESKGYEGYEGYVKSFSPGGKSYCIDSNYHKGISPNFCGTSRRTHVVEKANKLDMIGMLGIKGNESIRRVYEPGGVSPALTIMQGGNRQPKIIEACAIRGRNPQNPKSRQSGLPTQQMLEVSKNPDINNCLTTVQKDTMILEKPDFRIRKLTPKECFRLMGLNDQNIDKIQAAGISNSQQYKMAGNSIVVDCMKFLKQLKV